MIKINVLIGSKNWKKHIKFPERYLKNKVKNLNNKIVFFKKKKLEFSLLLSQDKEIKIFNNKFRKKNNATDVLSFPSCEKKMLKNLLLGKTKNVYLGDIIVSLEQILKKPKFKDIKEELNKLGTVKYLISPNSIHHLYMQDWKKEYPNAKIYSSPGLEKKDLN